MFHVQKHWAIGDAEFAVKKLVREHPGSQENPASAAALRVASEAVCALLRQAPMGCHVGLRVQGEFTVDGRGGVNIGVSFMTPEEADQLDAVERAATAAGPRHLTLVGEASGEAVGA